MTDLGPILDYASPRKRGRLRLPAVSRLAVDVGDGRVTVRESLAGQETAIMGLLLGAVVVVLCTAAAVGQVYHHGRWRLAHDDFAGGILAVLAVAEFATMIGVLQQTWRRTVLTVEYDDLRLSFLSPLRNRRHCWAGAAIADVLVVPTGDAADGRTLGEVLITRVTGGDIRLFTDHPAYQLVGLATAVHGMLREGRAEQPPVEVGLPVRLSVPTEPLNVAPQAEVTTGRLVDLQRIFRERRDGPKDAENTREV